ncbi:glutathione transferase GstA [Bordetella parapertussis]|uniref:Glutathione S-transferase n=2 Tax=Bordetella parapertussis TaxID=519 RepID=Q7W1M0_BORPA|nr:glutathione transferase GstA [Bordetella parapertussis]AOB37980.1 glutathione transferase GstA [Bordetella parapertussis]AUL41953.1 glutathione transferase GstA [Bordetella parapertussis]AWP61867.1 glutathione S-transferase [Bordetella parapertussis]AWP69364.1 glutathione S-transferase [Bordetella parapertussis]AWP87957.1 glutathione S-transferase [Bordetella parapertussis]
MKFYHEVRGCSLAVDIVARELGLALDLQWVDMANKRLADGSDYLKVNSKGTVPTLELPDGQFLSEDAVIMQYLADQRPQQGMLPAAGTLARYRVLEWMSFIAADLHKGGFMPLFKAITPPEYRRIARQYLDGRLQWLNDQLAGREFLMGETFTIADAHCYTIAMWTRAHDIDTSAWPHLEAYLARVGARPSVRAAEQAARDEGERQRAAAAR